MNINTNRVTSLQLPKLPESKLPASDDSIDVTTVAIATTEQSLFEKQMQAEIQQLRTSAQLHLEVQSRESTAKTSCKALHSNLFSAKELVNIEIGSAIIQDRIEKKRAILTLLEDKNISLSAKALVLLIDFGSLPYTGIFDCELVIQKEIQGYFQYVSILLYTYISAEKTAQLIVNSKTQAEKNKYQNNLYYYLSYEKKHYSEYMAKHFSHQIPEHSNEKHFYEMIYLKMCETATKEYDILNEYLNICPTPEGARIKIDNRKLLDQYLALHNKKTKEFNLSCPIFWMAAIDNPKVKELFYFKLETIKASIKTCYIEVVKIANELSEKINTYKGNSSTFCDHVVNIYNDLGPEILNAIGRYEKLTQKIVGIEREAIEYLKIFKEKNKLFRTLTIDQKELIRKYLQGQNELVELERKEKAKAVVMLHAQDKKIKEQKNQSNYSAEKVISTPSQQSIKSTVATEKSNLQSAKMSFANIEDVETKAISVCNEKESTQLDSGIISEKNIFCEAKSISILSEQTPEQSFENSKKIKVKTRPNNPANILTTPQIEIIDSDLECTLPVHMKTEEFLSLIENLLAETKPNALKKLFKELSKYDIFAENDEKNNKGYFCIKSPITNILHVRTYHHLHVKDNHFASMFLALRQVLIAADIVQR